MRTGLLAIGLLTLLTSCASLKSTNKTDGTKGNASAEVGSDSHDVHNEAAAKFKSYQLTESEPEGIAVPEFDQIPEEVMPSVQKWVQYFTGRGRDHMERYLSRSTRYERIMKKVLRENGMPTDLLYIALIESGFSPKAISRAAAVGYWQFIRGTGKKFGLEITSFIDERRDPILATQAAADYFKELYSNFNSWYLSMASYNVGEGRVAREVRRMNSKDFWYLAKKRRFPKETINYVPKFLAARMIAKDPEKYGFTEVPYEPPIEFETVALGEAVNLRLMADKMSIDYAELKRLNPKYRGEVAPLDRSKKLELRIPPGTSEVAIVAAKEAMVKEIVFIADRGEADVYKIRRGDNLNKIAKRFKTTVAALKDLNNFSRKMRIRPGRTIFVPLVVTRDDLADMNSNSKTAPGVYHTVSEGETLSDIADKNKISVQDIKELNKLNDGDVIRPGSKLIVQPLAVVKKPENVEVANADKANAVAEKSGSDNAEEKSDSKVAENKVIEKETDKLATKETDKSAVANQEKPKTVDAQIAAQIAPNAEAANTSANSATSTAPNASATSVVDNAKITHTVQSGENLTTIAKKYGTTVREIKKLNKMGRRTVLRAGRELIIPNKNQDKYNGTLNSKSQSLSLPSHKVAMKVHVVRHGESLNDIAKKYEVSISALVKRNKLLKSTRIVSGSRLYIPSEMN